MMATQFDSFNESPLGEFVESPLGERGEEIVSVPTFSGMPIVIMLPTTVWLTRTRQPYIVVQPGIPEWGDVGLQLFEHGQYQGVDGQALYTEDLGNLVSAFSADAGFDYGLVGKHRPNYRIYLWQPIAVEMAFSGYRFQEQFTTLPPAFPGDITSTTAMRENLLTAGVNDVRHLELGVSIRQLALRTAAAHLFVLDNFIILSSHSVPRNTQTLMDEPAIGTRSDDDVFYLQQSSLIDLFRRDVAALEPIWINPAGHTFNFEMILSIDRSSRVAETPHWFTSPFIDSQFRREGELTPVQELAAHITATEGNEARLTVGTFSSTRWPLIAASAIRSRMRGE